MSIWGLGSVARGRVAAEIIEIWCIFTLQIWLLRGGRIFLNWVELRVKSGASALYVESLTASKSGSALAV